MKPTPSNAIKHSVTLVKSDECSANVSNGPKGLPSKEQKRYIATEKFKSLPVGHVFNGYLIEFRGYDKMKSMWILGDIEI